MKEAQVNRDEFLNMTETLEQVESIAKATKFGLATDYAKGLSSEEIAYVFDGIVKLLSPVKDTLYSMSENIDVASNKKAVTK